MKKIFTLSAVMIFSLNVFSQITFQRTYGGLIGDISNSVKQTSDGGYIISGSTASYGAGQSDIYLIKTDSYGDTLWTKVFGGNYSEDGVDVIQVADGGYMIACFEISFTGPYTHYCIIKTDANGTMLWSKVYRGANPDVLEQVRQTSDAGFILIGSTSSFGAGNYDAYMIKTDSVGNLQWSKTYGGTSSDYGYSVFQTSDGGYVIGGATNSFGADSSDAYLIKTDTGGNVLWSKSFGGSGDDWCYSVQQTNDSGFIMTGATRSFGADSSEVYLVKTDASGNLTWSKTFGGNNFDFGQCVQQINGGGYMIAGYTFSFGAGAQDIYLLVTDGNGNLIWSKSYGTPNTEYCSSAMQTSDGGFILSSDTWIQHDSLIAVDFYIIKTDSLGDSPCNDSNPATISNSPPTQSSNPVTITTNPATLVVIPTISVSYGGIADIICSDFPSPDNSIYHHENLIFLSPNPATKEITVQSEKFKVESVDVYDLMGKHLILPFDYAQGDARVDVSSLSAGIYFVKVRGDREERTGKFVKQ